MLNKFKYTLAGIFTVAGCTTASIVGHSNRPVTLPTTGTDFAKVAVMITNPEHNSGGTGVVLDSRPGLTRILTNLHICRLIQRGGRVITDTNEEYLVEQFQTYTRHDLCVIGITADLGVRIKVAPQAPANYDGSYVVGHPRLLPTVITPGHFSKRQTIDLMVGLTPCDGKESEDEAIACALLGGKPMTRVYTGQLTSSLIMPGSSGSGVFNSKGELGGVIFAGLEGLGYGYLVPWEYVHDFLTNINQYKVRVVDPTKPPENFFAIYAKLEKECLRKNDKLVNMCHNIANLGLWNE